MWNHLGHCDLREENIVCLVSWLARQAMLGDIFWSAERELGVFAAGNVPRGFLPLPGDSPRLILPQGMGNPEVRGRE